MRLLIVEDDASVARFLEKGLQEERYAVDIATDGETAIALAQYTAYDVIILDVMLPKQDGLSICRILRDKGQTAPVLLLTVRDSTEDKVRGLDCGADDYLTKPFAFAELLARLRALLRRGTVQGPGRLKLADLELDPAAHRVWRDETEIVLTSKEYALLEYLLRNADRVLTRTVDTYVLNEQGQYVLSNEGPTDWSWRCIKSCLRDAGQRIGTWAAICLAACLIIGGVAGVVSGGAAFVPVFIACLRTCSGIALSSISSSLRSCLSGC